MSLLCILLPRYPFEHLFVPDANNALEKIVNNGREENTGNIKYVHAVVIVQVEL